MNGIRTKLVASRSNLVKQNVICKRWSGHNVMDVEPSNWSWRKFKDALHLHGMLVGVPMAVIVTIINIRANPELTEIPEGYEPRHWEYFKHPISRWMAKYMFLPMEIEQELTLASYEYQAETQIMKEIQTNCEKVMSFYNDHRSRYFWPFSADYFRIGRDAYEYGLSVTTTSEGHYYDYGYDPKITNVPTEGYRSADYDNIGKE